MSDFSTRELRDPVVPSVANTMRGELGAIPASEILEQINDSVIVCDASGRIQYWNSGSEKLYGWPADEALGRNVHALLGTRLSGAAADVDDRLAAEGHWQGELQQVTRSGAAVWVHSHCKVEVSALDAPRLVISSDITERKDAEHALRCIEERYRRFVDEDLTGDFIVRSDGAILTCNPAFVRIFGFSSVQEVLSTNFTSLLRTRKDGAELIAAVREHRVAERNELEMRQPQGEPVYVAARFVGSFDEHGELTEVQGYLFNDTRRKRFEHQVIQAQKMEGLGTLAGGIAHDFNNILAIILGYASQLDSMSVRTEQIPGAVKVIKEAVERGAALVQQLLTSARQAEARFASLDLNNLLRELEKMLQATFPKTIDFKLHLGPHVPPLTADRGQLHQVLLNLCVNARDAMPHGGTIVFETSLVSGREVAEDFTGAEAEEYARIRVRDTGSGMTPEVRSHIFEPFFTTKERAKGTGLGLSVVYGVVNNHRGFVQVESEPEQGTTFSIYLPVLRQREHLPNGAAIASAKPREPQTILVVEDEEMLRDLALQILEGEGYRVLAARDGLEAVAMFDEHRDEIGLVICDLGLPKLGGRDVFMRMKECKPTVRAIVASGYLEPSIRSEILKAGVIDTIQKPYDFRDLLEKIRSVIGDAVAKESHP
ncbi:MAG: PAS domain S-box protein [Chthoniobacterales bacterium]|nr:PAS domain S-box protein [Chthoniobacterales bacterium]